VARVAAKNAEIYMNEHNLSGRSNSIELSVDNDLFDVTAFGDSAKEYIEGLYAWTLDINAFLDCDDDEIDENLFAEIAAGGAHLGYAPIGTGTKGNRVYEMTGMVRGQPRPIAVAGAQLVACTFEGTGSLFGGQLHCNQSVSGSGVVSGSNLDHGAGTSSGTTFVAIVRCLADNISSVTVKVQDSPNDSDWSDISGMSQTFSAVGSWRLSTTNATDRYKRVNVSSFSGTSCTLYVAMGVLQGT
jgi:hypothetical protein